jgi:hypothetical protein
VIDHNFQSNANALIANINHSAYLGVGSNGDNSWAQPDSFGTTNALYIESNTFDSNGSAATDCDVWPETGWIGGCRFVIRFNTFNGFTGAAVTNHGTESGGRMRGARQMEVYANDAYCISSSGCQSLTGTRSGTLMQFGNVIRTFGTCTPSCSFVNGAITSSVLRIYTNFDHWGTCDGADSYDNNDPAVFYTGTITSTSSTGTVTDTGETWQATLGANWAQNAVTAGVPFSIHDAAAVGNTGSNVLGIGSQITSYDSTAHTLTLLNWPVCNWGTQVHCTFTAGETYTIRKANACLDQVGRGSGTYYSGSATTCAGWTTGAAPCSSANQTLDPIYEWADQGLPCITGTPNCTAGSTFHGYNQGVFSSSAKQIANNRDGYAELKNQTAQTGVGAPFNGTVTVNGSQAGVGHGLWANRPATCTAGTGYFATDQGPTWNVNNTPIPGMSTTQGQLYICGASGWPDVSAPSYVPLTYPHPLLGPVPLITISPTLLSFGNVSTGTSSNPAFATVSNNTTSPITLNTPYYVISGTNAADYTNTGSVNNPCQNGLVMAAGSTCIVGITFSPSATGSRTATITINSSVGSAAASLTGAGTQATLLIAPSSYAFGNVNVGATSAPQTVTLTNTGTGTLTGLFQNQVISDLNNYQISANACGSTLATSASCTLQIVCHPVVSGLINANMTFITNANNSPTVATLTCTGVVSGVQQGITIKGGIDITGGPAVQ